ncbi:hypothetical protein CLIB1423_21S00188 [[Candida] railenensis]|uniref:SET domain-containing protein n=1 Tax=[Candida] railenensis TaxID=45579 RepID=A0A9P0VZI4_9ASCO|nr:hypothetical protein CLIB1423_21S00188 [[Candida] railenensis]
MNKAEEEQLLQDASTLLMFANVAAKQQIQHAPSATSYSPESSVQEQQQQQSSNNPSIKSSSRSPIENSPISYPNFHNIHSRTPSGSGPVQPTHPSPATNEQRIPEVKHEASASKGYYFPVASTESEQQSQQPQNQPPQHQQQQQSQQPSDKLPPQASFKSHKRVASSGSSGSFRHSPGPANIASAGGIIESGNNRNSSNNAMIVAAALADAASIPLPLLKKTEDTKRIAEVVDSASSKPDETEVEEDATEDEKESKNVDERSTNTTLEDSSPQAQNEEIDRKHQPSQDHNNNEVLPPASPKVAPTQINVEIQKVSPVLQSASVVTQVKPLSDSDISSSADQVALESNQVKIEPSVQNPPEGPKIAGSEPEAVPIPPLTSYKVDPDAGTIGCICGIDDDDGFTVQCDICFRWQHCLCMNLMTNEEVPDIYKCYFCDEHKWGKFDPEDCRKQTLARLENERLGDENEPEFKKELKRKHSNSEKGDKKRKTSESKKRKDDEDVKKGELGTGLELGKTDEKFANETKLLNNTSESNGGNSGNGSSGGSLSNSQAQAQAQAEILSLPNKDNDLLEGGIAAESYQGTYYKLRDNDYKTQSIKLAFEELAQMNLKNKAVESLSKVEFKNIRFSKIILPNYERKLQQMKKKSSTSFNDTSIQVKQYSDNQKQKFNGISRLGLFISKRKQGSGGIIPENTPVIEYLGELSLFQQYIDDKTNQYNLWGVPKPRVLKTELPFAGNESSSGASVGIISDARFVGNESRFIRNSCPANANCIIKPVFIKEQKIFKLLVVTSKPIIFGPDQSEEELRIEWQWDEKHPIRRMYEKIEEPGTGTNNTPGGGNKQEAIKFDQFSETDKGLLISGVDNVLNFAECACGTASPVANSNCVLFKIKKATAYLLRSTRKALSVGSLGLGKSRELLIINKNPKKYISWQERLDERDRTITMDLLCEVGQEDIKDRQDGGAAEAAESEEKSLHESGSATDDVSMNGTAEDEKADADDMEIDTEAKSTEGSNQTKSIVEARVPYREQLIAKSRKLKDVTVELNKAANGASKNLCAPIVPELIIKIQKEVSEKIALPVNIVRITNEKFKIEPVVESSIASKAVPGVLERKFSSASIAANTAVDNVAVVDSVKAAASVNPGIPAASEKPSAPLEVKNETVAPKPPVVKKLSFADYKKKMK